MCMYIYVIYITLYKVAQRPRGQKILLFPYALLYIVAKFLTVVKKEDLKGIGCNKK